MEWNPQQYLGFADLRLRPALDLLARVPAAAPVTRTRAAVAVVVAG